MGSDHHIIELDQAGLQTGFFLKDIQSGFKLRMFPAVINQGLFIDNRTTAGIDQNGIDK